MRLFITIIVEQFSPFNSAIILTKNMKFWKLKKMACMQLFCRNFKDFERKFLPLKLDEL